MIGLTIATTSVPAWSKLGYVVGFVGLCFAAIRWWNERRERKRIRPVVIVHQQRSRYVNDKLGLVQPVYLTNESATSAFNIRFGVQIGDAEVLWKHDQADSAASRLNVLRPSARHPDGGGVVDVVIPYDIGFPTEGHPHGGTCWARYESPAGERWYTSNPVERSSDLIVKRVRSRRWTDWRTARAARRQAKTGQARIADANQELREKILDHVNERDDPAT